MFWSWNSLILSAHALIYPSQARLFGAPLNQVHLYMHTKWIEKWTWNPCQSWLLLYYSLHPPPPLQLSFCTPIFLSTPYHPRPVTSSGQRGKHSSRPSVCPTKWHYKAYSVPPHPLLAIRHGIHRTNSSQRLLLIHCFVIPKTFELYSTCEATVSIIFSFSVTLHDSDRDPFLKKQ